MDIVPLARCQKCGLIFRSALFSMFGFEARATGTFVGNSETCPRCGGMADIQDVIGGENLGWRLATEAARLLFNADADRVNFIREVAQGVSRGEISTQEAEQRIGDAGKSIGKVIQFAKEWGLLGVFIAMLSYCNDIKTSRQDLTIEELQRRLDGLAQQQEQTVPDYRAIPRQAPVQLVPTSSSRPGHMSPGDFKTWWDQNKRS